MRDCLLLTRPTFFLDVLPCPEEMGLTVPASLSQGLIKSAFLLPHGDSTGRPSVGPLIPLTLRQAGLNHIVITRSASLSLSSPLNGQSNLGLVILACTLIASVLLSVFLSPTSSPSDYTLTF